MTELYLTRCMNCRVLVAYFSGVADEVPFHKLMVIYRNVLTIGAFLSESCFND